MQSNRISNKTQCPHCFTIYQISEDQLAQSRGNVRCGNCHERFKAQLLSDDEIKQARSKVAPNNDLFADVNEPTTRNPSADATLQETKQRSVESKDNIDKKVDITKPEAADFTRSAPNIEVTNELDVVENPIKDLSLERRSPEPTEFNEPKHSNYSANIDRKEPVFDFELQDSELELPSFGTKRESSFNANNLNKDLDFVFDDAKAGLSTQDSNNFSEPPSENFSEPASQEPPAAGSIAATPNDNQELINEIDRIIDDRLINGSNSRDRSVDVPSLDSIDPDAQTEKPDSGYARLDVRDSVRSIDWSEEVSHDVDSSDFDDNLDTNSEGSSEVTWINEDDLFVEPSDKLGSNRSVALKIIKFGLTGIVVVGLIVLLAYQVWLKQFAFVNNNETTLTTLNALFTPAFDYLQDRGIFLARPQNLMGLALISAQSEPHPSRSSTTLMKVSFLNKASVEQNLPWLELSLTDESGKVVARRALQPEDYLYNNTTQARIGPHELKKITIELLAFPKSATGFELKMLKNMSS
ncbi:MAG: DUF3426 domain-containing protein [Arenicella sp.]|nr:DUF3426 domain-containing protein [Arenicella sp.]